MQSRVKYRSSSKKNKRARLDALVEEEDRLLTETISLGNTKSDVARKKVLQTKIDEIQARTAAS